ncbi:MAG: hypothetical protein WC829_02750 [Hyphomicrobium sp.]|jgi:hypothetical protein
MDASKEQVYDAEIEPLMAKILDICQVAGIGMLADFEIQSPDDEGLRCTSALPDETGKNSERHRRAIAILMPPRPKPLMLTTTHADGSVTMTAVLP